MGRKEEFLLALKSESSGEKLPLWELHFHLWDKYSTEKFISGEAFSKLTLKEQDYHVKLNAEILACVGEKIGFGGVSIPDSPWACHYTLPFEMRVKLIKELKILKPDFAIVAGGTGVISMPASSDSYLDFCYRLFDEPEEIDKYCKELYEKWLNDVEELCEAGVEVCYIAADVADNRATFFNREQLDRWYFPYLKMSAEHLEKLGIISVLHTDGNISNVLNDIKNSGIYSLQAIDPVAGMDIKEVKRELKNKVSLCGNLDCGLMLTGTAEEVYHAAKCLINICREGGGFILGNSNAVAYETPVENYNAFLKAWRE